MKPTHNIAGSLAMKYLDQPPSDAELQELYAAISTLEQRLEAATAPVGEEVEQMCDKLSTTQEALEHGCTLTATEIRYLGEAAALLRSQAREIAEAKGKKDQCVMCDSKNIDHQRTHTVCRDCGADTMDNEQSQRALIDHLKAELERAEAALSRVRAETPEEDAKVCRHCEMPFSEDHVCSNPYSG